MLPGEDHHLPIPLCIANAPFSNANTPPSNASTPSFGLYTILPLPILCGVYCNNGGSGGNNILCNSVSDDGEGLGA